MAFVFLGNVGGNEHNREFGDLQSVIDYAEQLKKDELDLRYYKIELGTPSGFIQLLSYTREGEALPAPPPQPAGSLSST